MKAFIQTLMLVATSLISLSSYASITVTDSLGQHQLSETPKRIVALNWDLAEQLIELDVTPVGVPNIKDYTTWVVKPAIPESVQDVGTRAEPNMEKLAALKPDVILVAEPQKDLIPRLKTIAPVLYYQTYNADQDSAKAAIENFNNIAHLVGKTDLAEQKLQAMHNRFSELKQQINVAFAGQMPSIAAMRFANQTSIYLYAKNSTTDYVIKQLGLTTALPQPAKEWGIVQKRLTDLQHLKDGYVIYFGPVTDTQEAQLNKSMLWKAMPFVRNGHVNKADPVWNYGGAMSMQYIAESLTKSLLELQAPK